MEEEEIWIPPLVDNLIDGEVVIYEDPNDKLCKEWLYNFDYIRATWEIEPKEDHENQQNLSCPSLDLEVEKEKTWTPAFIDQLMNDEHNDHKEAKDNEMLLYEKWLQEFGNINVAQEDAHLSPSQGKKGKSMEKEEIWEPVVERGKAHNPNSIAI